MAYNGLDFVAPFDPTAYEAIDGAQLAQLVGGLGPMVGSIGLFIKTTDISGAPQVPDTTTYPKLKAYGWLRIQANNNATLYIWNDNGAVAPPLGQWQVANISSITVGSITGSQIAALTITDSNILSVGWSKLPSGAAVGGCLVGSMPNPSLANAVVVAASVAALSVDNTKIIPSVTPLQQLRVNNAGTAVEWFSPTLTQTISGISATALLFNGAIAQVVVAHTLGAVPSSVKLVLQCVGVDANTGYAVNDELSISTIVVTGQVYSALSYFVDNANLYINWNVAAQAVLSIFAGSGAPTAPSAWNNFKFKVYLGV